MLQYRGPGLFAIISLKNIVFTAFSMENAVIIRALPYRP